MAKHRETFEPPSHGGGQGFESPRVHFLFPSICVPSPAARASRGFIGKTTPPAMPKAAYPSSMAAVMRPARFGGAGVQTPTAKADTSRVYGISLSAIMRGLTGDPCAVNSLNSRSAYL